MILSMLSPCMISAFHRLSKNGRQLYKPTTENYLRLMQCMPMTDCNGWQWYRVTRITDTCWYLSDNSGSLITLYLVYLDNIVVTVGDSVQSLTRGDVETTKIGKSGQCGHHRKYLINVWRIELSKCFLAKLIWLECGLQIDWSIIVVFDVWRLATTL